MRKWLIFVSALAVVAGALALVALFFADPTEAVQQNAIQLSKQQQEIRRLPPAGIDPELDRWRCGDFFIFGDIHMTSHEEENGKHVKRIGYFLLDNEKAPGVAMGGLFLPDKFVVITDNSKKAPTVELVYSNGGTVVDKVVVRIAQWHKEQATCLAGLKTKTQ